RELHLPHHVGARIGDRDLFGADAAHGVDGLERVERAGQGHDPGVDRDRLDVVAGGRLTADGGVHDELGTELALFDVDRDPRRGWVDGDAANVAAPHVARLQLDAVLVDVDLQTGEVHHSVNVVDQRHQAFRPR